MWLALLMLVTAGPDAGGCDEVALRDVPPAAQAMLSLQAGGDGGLVSVCRVQRNGDLSYRARGRSSGITVEVTATGTVVWRHWHGAD
jgi:hypothetical protein